MFMQTLRNQADQSLSKKVVVHFVVLSLFFLTCQCRSIPDVNAWREYLQRDDERLQCLKEIREKIVKDYEPLFRQQTGGLALIDVSVHDNLGDNLLTQGMIELARTFHRMPTIICQDFQSRDKSVNPPMWGGWEEPWAIPKCNVKLWMMAFLVKAKKNGTES
eukprot:TRINITY_DN15491_c1_g2_i1.p1 TRINITY_DN15491_c1_g2~~TRINITY_DN15491_c1_g2_i1.p1  ORF type:complete len:162 (+),score=17.19 TRINITY_DN15491_c1_g2_i1:216-701(+)